MQLRLRSPTLASEFAGKHLTAGLLRGSSNQDEGELGRLCYSPEFANVEAETM